MARRAGADEIEIEETAEPEAYSAGIAATALRASQFAPDFILPDLRGGTVSLSDLLASGPVVLTFHRGGLGPHSAASLRALAAVQPDVARLGAAIAVILLPEPAATSDVDGSALPFAIARDRAGTVARAYGLAPTSRRRHDEALPIPATYVVDRDGRIALSFIDIDHRNRVEPDQLLAALAGLRHRQGG